jgi:PEP-CTERM motif
MDWPSQGAPGRGVVSRGASNALAIALAGVAFVALSAAPGFAVGLTGQSLGATYYFPDAATPYGSASFTPGTFVVGAREETLGNVEGVTFLHVDFEDDTLTITLETVLSAPTWTATAFNGVIFSAGAPHGVVSAAVNGATTLAGFDDSRVSLTGSEIRIDWGGLSYVDGTVVKIDFSFVPEPGTLLLASTGFLGLAVRRRSATAALRRIAPSARSGAADLAALAPRHSRS